MKMNITQLLKHPTRTLLLALAFTQGAELASAATYRVGDVATNFTFVARRAFTRPDGTAVPAGATVRLQDFAGRVVFLEWFAVWCPFCVAAAPQVETGIVDYYAARNGNPHGVPVLHIAVNQESASFYQTRTDTFVTQQGFAITVNDYDSTSTNRVRFLFQSSGQPIFAVINGVTNSPTHQPWQVLVNHLGYGDTDFNTELASFRAAIDQVQAPVPAPQLSGARAIGANFEFTLQTQAGRSYRVQGSDNLTDWTTLATISGSASPILFRDTNAPPSRRFYRAVTP
jgi:thiol-disulfide isomerase/thioredoxin